MEVNNLEDALSGSLEIISETLNSEAGAIWLLDKATDRLAPLFHSVLRTYPTPPWKTGWALRAWSPGRDGPCS